MSQDEVDAQNAQLLESDTSVQPYSSPEAEVVQEALPRVEEGRSKCTFRTKILFN